MRYSIEEYSPTPEPPITIKPLNGPAYTGSPDGEGGTYWRVRDTVTNHVVSEGWRTLIGATSKVRELLREAKARS